MATVRENVVCHKGWDFKSKFSFYLENLIVVPATLLDPYFEECYYGDELQEKGGKGKILYDEVYLHEPYVAKTQHRLTIEI